LPRDDDVRRDRPGGDERLVDAADGGLGSDTLVSSGPFRSTLLDGGSRNDACDRGSLDTFTSCETQS
jgi:hypothetical protein